ncbi:hypothetical protein OBBRIDRAFT_718201 [Obba rivulosa]|uniref:Uncharacterized protein n=1 Tax=Obba rivulosa TaxID=1052685 RepID=A0A8E2DVH9_9APHY|nr:hypothetical protein OBBRIDRAFT_718201 [Obba rivulosa]
MSFQHFRLHPIAPHPSQQTLANASGSSSIVQSSLSQALGQQPEQMMQPGPNIQMQPPMSSGSKKGPYGSGDADDGYTLVFESMAAFQAWRQHEEEEKMVEFVKGDTHGSKAVPPRFKDHTKLVCARHSRSGRKKYVKKYPDRVRKVPSRKLEGLGCPASISYKTYYETEEVRACYIADHSHEIGLANLPFTKRGRKAAAEQQAREKSRSRTVRQQHDGDSSSETPPSSALSPPASGNPIAGPSTQPQMAPSLPTAHAYNPSVSAFAPVQQMAPPPPMNMSQERWDRMTVLFESIRDHARTFEYPSPSVVALESVLIRLYLESPMGSSLAGPLPSAGMGGLGDAGVAGLEGIPDPGHVGA